MGCRQRGDRSRLLRVVAAGVDGVVSAVPDPQARQPGRGAWVHADPACLDLAERRRAFSRALRQQGPVDASAVRAHLQQAPAPPARPAPPAPPARPAAPPPAPSTPSTSTGSGSASDGHPMSSQR
ncbi:YlxR family protein [Quadrisphaera sp. DSM 44207]|uniref:YlxR family protein n=1 Tax=Quadrisphaera sp. DSM 44207 TaxID=1881057 RepID=UPI001C40953D